MPSIAFLGAGNIAQAIMGGLAEGDHELHAFDPAPACCNAARNLGASIAADNRQAAEQAEVIILCVKPDVVAGLVAEEKATLRGKLTISVAAGVTTGTLLASLGADAALVRCMPNTPALVNAGMTALFATPGVMQPQKALAEGILAAVGDTLWVDQEDALDAVTAVSGSGPAYFFLMMEAMIDAAEAEGLDAKTAKHLVLQTALGASTMARFSPDSPSRLRTRVTSPGGTTQAALEKFRELNLPEIVKAAVHAAKVRSEELSKS